MAKQADREAEWANILDYGKEHEWIGYWLKERETRFRLGQPSDDHTKHIRALYRKFLRGEVDDEGRLKR